MAAFHCWTGIALCLVYIHHTSGDYEKRCRLEDRLRSPVGVCGSQLSDLLTIVCDGKYQKRALMNTADHEWAENTAASEAADDDTNKDISNEEKIFMSKNQAMSYLQHKRTVYSDGSSVGIVCECCTHQCSLGELAQYCQGGRSAFHSKRSWKPEYHKPDSFASRSANKITDITDTDHPQSHDKTGESLHTTSDQNKEFTQMILASMFPQRKLHAV